MRALVYSLIFTLFLTVFGIYTNNKLFEFVDLYVSDVTAIEDLIKEDNWDEAKSKLDEYVSSFDDNKGRWYMILDHQYFIEISCYVDILDSGIYLKNKSLSLEQIARINSTLKDIIQNETCNFDNVL